MSKEETKKKVQAPKEKANKQIQELTAELSREKEDYMRLMAEFETFRRRTAEEKLAMVATASADTIKELLPVLDACGQAVKMLANSEDEAAKQGTQLIFDKLLNALKARGLAVIEAQGKDFDTDFHEAITQIPAPGEELKGKVLDVTRTGYTLNGKVLRYAQVVVGA